MPREIERRFVLNQLPSSVELHRPDHVHQAYTVIDPTAEREERVRYRKSSNGMVSYEHFHKIGRGRDREEVATPISPDEFRIAFTACLGDPVIKDIYHEQWGGRWIELHVFRSHRPFMTVEIEFGHEQAAMDFVPFEWLGHEVTNDPRYNSASIALFGIPNDFIPNDDLVRRFYGATGVAPDAAFPTR